MSDESDTWEFYKDKEGEHRWRRLASDGHIVGAAVEHYASTASCEANAERHGYHDNPKNLGANDRWEFYTDMSGRHRWRRTATSLEIVGSSSEGYSSIVACRENAQRNGHQS